MSEAPQVVVVGAASRDLVDDDAARLAARRRGLVLGARARAAGPAGRGRWSASTGPAADADELDLLRAAGAEVQLVHLAARARCS